MATTYKIGIIGNKDAILPFRIIGFDIYPVLTASEAKETIKQLAEENYGIIYLTEDFAQQIPDTIKYYDTQVTPAIILLPSHRGNLGIGLQRIQDNVEKAVGANIL
ncbi:V-type ATP synthase subunit F [Ignavigranum ruoffiae]|uniref:V/A-type H+-transporting ATPase subunit F n=1 Tax=Ignavigranum ruoffiae TaxID=89093 RepID=A0A1H8YXP5_9LACT|nr:V-type ATP synthase subunit F [Ignavigranum ruoffiae]UPQ85409.1 V-type ATP synthase subunit F [Ignavigranum ruoffiae]SEP56964.1 V/A-type H+-transporting ATPase subunit F [Ignavigranum ruoffiae]